MKRRIIGILLLIISSPILFALLIGSTRDLHDEGPTKVDGVGVIITIIFLPLLFLGVALILKNEKQQDSN